MPEASRLQVFAVCIMTFTSDWAPWSQRSDESWSSVFQRGAGSQVLGSARQSAKAQQGYLNISACFQWPVVRGFRSFWAYVEDPSLMKQP